MSQDVALFSLRSSHSDFRNCHTECYVPGNVISPRPLSTLWNETATVSQGAPSKQNPGSSQGPRATKVQLPFALGILPEHNLQYEVCAAGRAVLCYYVEAAEGARSAGTAPGTRGENPHHYQHFWGHCLQQGTPNHYSESDTRHESKLH